MAPSNETRPFRAAGLGKLSFPGGNDNPTHKSRPPISQAAIPPPAASRVRLQYFARRLHALELDAIDPNRLHTLVEEVIVRHLPPDQYAILIEAEKSERTLFQGPAGLVRQLAQRKAPGAEHAS